jgi:hypothetical protein
MKYVSSVLIYVTETWRFKSTILSTIDACQMKKFCRTEGFRWDEFLRNERLLAHSHQAPFSTQIAE